MCGADYMGVRNQKATKIAPCDGIDDPGTLWKDSKIVNQLAKETNHFFIEAQNWGHEKHFLSRTTFFFAKKNNVKISFFLRKKRKRLDFAFSREKKNEIPKSNRKNDKSITTQRLYTPEFRGTHGLRHIMKVTIYTLMHS
eukprot:GEMP01109519.1.p1 GENE.GEMP01109519.1~~GEMP01109519.1.p1  ORF type:complete len:140 (-),score=4.09 GEMP01109519.1:81-500(-)